MSEPVVPVVRRPDYTIGLEQNSGNTWVHARIHRWSTRIARAYRRDADALFELHGGPVFATTHDPHGGDQRKFEKFCRMFGFVHWGTVEFEGVDRDIYVRTE
jgi:hypothetical protein